MKALMNNYDKEVCFTSLEEAKKYYMPDVEEFPECVAYAKDISEVFDLEELAEVFNTYSDEFENGSRCFVEEI